MALDELFLARMNVHGITDRERILNRQKDFIYRKMLGSLSCKEVKLNGEINKLVIESGNHTYEKKLCSLPGERFKTGDYVEWANATWLITEADYDNEFYVDGQMEQCNWELKWQKSDGSIAKYWCIDSNATQYNSGESTVAAGKITLGSSQHMLKLPCTQDTLGLRSPQRLFLDKNPVNPTAFKVTQNDNTVHNYGNGLIDVTCIEDKFKQDKDKLITLDSGEQVWIADYFSPPPEILPGADTPTGKIEGRTDLIIGRERTYTALFDDYNISLSDCSWNIISSFDASNITQTRGANGSIKLLVSNEDMVGGEFILQLLYKSDVAAQVIIFIRDMF